MTTAPGFEGERPRLAVLTGDQRAGKTTAARRIVEAARARGLRCGGFLSPDALSPDGQKTGIALWSQADDSRRLLALVGDGLPGPRIGPYSFDQTVLDWGIGLFRADIERGCDLVTVDELGRLEFERGLGFAPLLPDLAAGSYQRALIVGRLGLCERLRDLCPEVEVEVFQITANPESRAPLPEIVLSWLLGDDTPCLSLADRVGEDGGERW
jgi:hypothetical protein